MNYYLLVPGEDWQWIVRLYLGERSWNNYVMGRVSDPGR